MSEPPVQDQQVTNNPATNRYELSIGGDIAGYVEYDDRGGRRALVHTVVEPAYEGRGLASMLIKTVLEDVRAAGREMLPVCPFVRAYLDRHPEYVELVPASERTGFDLPTG